jgi:hypothetical protein
MITMYDFTKKIFLDTLLLRYNFFTTTVADYYLLPTINQDGFESVKNVYTFFSVGQGWR